MPSVQRAMLAFGGECLSDSVALAFKQSSGQYAAAREAVSLLS